MKRKRYDGLRVFILLIALGLLLYPALSNYLYEKNSSKVAAVYDEEAVQMGERAKEEMLQKARDYNREMLRNVELMDPFSSAGGEVNERYESILRVDQAGMMGYIRIPAIDVQLAIYHGTEEQVLQVGVGHFGGTSFPVGGESTHAVLTGHRGIPTKKMFRDMDRISLGDVFYIKILGETYAYQVDQLLTVLPEETEALSVVPGEDLVTLVTCTPYAINTHRLLVRGHRIPYEEAVKVSVDAPVEAELPFQVKVLIAAVVILLILLVILVAGERFKKKGMFSFILIFLCTCSAYSMDAMAAEDQPGSICIIYHGRIGEMKKIPLTEVPFALYEVGTLQDGRWVLEEGFRDSGVSLEGEGALERETQAAQLYAYAKEQGLKGETERTDANGVVLFGGLQEKMYLAAQTEKKVTRQKGSFMSEPFLVAVPEEIEGETVYEITIGLKSGWTPEEDSNGGLEEKPEKPEKPPEDKPGNGGSGSGGGGSDWEGGSSQEQDRGTENSPEQELPSAPAADTEELPEPITELPASVSQAGAQTGDDSHLVRYTVCLLASMGMILILLYMEKKRK